MHDGRQASTTAATQPIKPKKLNIPIYHKLIDL